MTLKNKEEEDRENNTKEKLILVLLRTGQGQGVRRALLAGVGLSPHRARFGLEGIRALPETWQGDVFHTLLMRIKEAN